MEPAEANIMKRPPYTSEESIFGRGLVPFVAVMGVVMSLISLGIGVWSFRSGDPAWQTLLFTTLIFCQVILALEVRSERDSLCLLYTSPSPRDRTRSRMPSSACTKKNNTTTSTTILQLNIY